MSEKRIDRFYLTLWTPPHIEARSGLKRGESAMGWYTLLLARDAYDPLTNEEFVELVTRIQATINLYSVELNFGGKEGHDEAD